MRYCIKRFFNHGGSRVVKRGLTKEQAQAHCSNPETSSRTCTTAKCKRYTRLHGAWFDGYEEEPCRGRRR